jgi:opacity protein-like surface antigen
MKCKIFLVLALMFALSPLARAQDYKMELIPFFGYTLSNGIDFTAADIGNGVIVDRITPVSGFTWGFQADVLASEMFAIGFQYSDQSSKLELREVSGQKNEITDLNVRNYHAMFTLNLGDERAPARPFIFLGLGATQYSPDDIMGSSVDSETKFSTSWGGGVKWYGSDHIGVRMGIRWTPTYISSNPAGYWCSPFWPGGCWLISEANYSHQFEFNGGLILRF